MKLKIIFFVFVAFLSFSVTAQDSTITRKPPPKKNIWEKVYFGGNLGLQFGTSTFIDVSPLVGYKITENFSAGVGVTFQYFRYKDRLYELQTNVYGARVFCRYLFYDNLFGHAEYEYLNLEAFDYIIPRRVDVASFLVGGGYIQRFGRNSAIVGMLLYNFTESYYTPYQNPIIRIGVNIGL